MKNVHPVEAVGLAVMALTWAAITIARAVLVPLVALGLAACGAGHQARPVAPEPPAAPWVPPTPPALETLPVAALRRLAREAGLGRYLGRSGRRGELLMALAVAW